MSELKETLTELICEGLRRFSLGLVRFGLWIYDAETSKKWTDEDWKNYRELKEMEAELVKEASR